LLNLSYTTELSQYSRTFEFLLGKAKSNVDGAWMRLLDEAKNHEPEQDLQQDEKA
jgi:hypothetical protein